MAVPRFYLSGTGTDVGKTHFARLVLADLLERGGDSPASRPIYLKPVESGVPGDSSVIRSAFGSRVETIAFHSFRPACSPHLAAEIEEVRIRPASWLPKIDSLLATGRPLLVEGAGGALSPLTRRMDQADLARKLDLPLVLVGDGSLGAIHSFAATIEALGARGVRIHALVFNRRDRQKAALDATIRRDNASFLRRRYGIFSGDVDDPAFRRKLFSSF